MEKTDFYSPNSIIEKFFTSFPLKKLFLKPHLRVFPDPAAGNPSGKPFFEIIVKRGKELNPLLGNFFKRSAVFAVLGMQDEKEEFLLA